MAGTLFIVGVGPGDPDLITLKAARVIAAAPVVAFFAKRGAVGHARHIAAAHLSAHCLELRFEYPFTTEIGLDDPAYAAGMTLFYDAAARAIAERLDAEQDVALLCEGDPFLYGSAMYVFDRLGAYRHDVVPGVSGMSGCWSRAGLPFTHGGDVLMVLPGTLDAPSLAARLSQCNAAVIMKVGRNLAKVRRAVEAAGLTSRALYVERGTMPGERVVPLAEYCGERGPYFSIVLIPGEGRRL